MRMADYPECCVVDCGRKVSAQGLCATHRRQLERMGTFHPIRPHRSPRKGTVRLAGLSVSRDCARKLERFVRERGLTMNAAITDIIEAWAVRTHRSQAGMAP